MLIISYNWSKTNNKMANKVKIRMNNKKKIKKTSGV